MILCLSCGHVSARSATFCGHCGRSLGCRMCDKGHRNPLGSADSGGSDADSFGSAFCTTCQSVQLSEGARCLRLNWLSTLITAVIAVFAWKAFLAHPLPVLRALFSAAAQSAAFMLNTSPGHLGALTRAAFAWTVVLWLFGECLRLMPSRGGKIGAWLRGLPLLLPQIAFRFACRAGRLLARWAVYRVLFGQPPHRARRGTGAQAGQKGAGTQSDNFSEN